jgi:hypothetical protein
MAENEATAPVFNEEQKPLEEQSPSEKLEKTAPDYQTTPGAENPDSKEVKQEINPNTE